MDEFQSLDTLIGAKQPDLPVTCFKPSALRAAATWFLGNLPGSTLYAVKANPAPYVIEGLFAAGIRHFDAASLPEIALVRQHAPGSFIAFMHPVKSREAIRSAYFDHGVRHFSFDTRDELDKIVACTGGAKDIGLILRLAVPNATAELPLNDKFGAAPLQAADLLRTARGYARHIGISFHVGSQTMNPDAYTNALGIVGGILRTLPDTPVDIIDIGGGFPSIYPGMEPPALAAYSSAICQGLANLPLCASREVWYEPGRALVAESASVIVKVEARKGDTLYINDGTYGSLFDAGQSVGFRYPVRRIDQRSGTSAALAPFRFYGPTCDSIDYMPGPFMLPADTAEGDYIEIGQLGAYGSTMRTNFNGFYAHELITVDAPPLMSLYSDDQPAHQDRAARALA